MLNDIAKNLGTFTNAYGLDSGSGKLIEDIVKGGSRVVRVGVIIRDVKSKRPLVCCEFPPEGDMADCMLWVPIGEIAVEAAPTYTREARPYLTLKNIWKRIASVFEGQDILLITEGPITISVHSSLAREGIVEKYSNADGVGYLRRVRSGIFFRRQWCLDDDIRVGDEVSFVPVISRYGLQGRSLRKTTV